MRPTNPRFLPSDAQVVRIAQPRARHATGGAGRFSSWRPMVLQAGSHTRVRQPLVRSRNAHENSRGGIGLAPTKPRRVTASVAAAAFAAAW